jgi:transposase
VIPSGVQIFVALEPVDMRWSFDRLAGAAIERIGYDACSGALFIYFGKRKDAVKVLFFDGSGMCLFYKRLDRRVFRVPASGSDARHVELDEGCWTRCSMGWMSAMRPSRSAIVDRASAFIDAPRAPFLLDKSASLL